MVLLVRSQYLGQEAARKSGKLKGSLNFRFQKKREGKLPVFYAGTADYDSVVGASHATVVPTQRSGKLLVQLLATYPIATEIARHLRRTELMQLALAANSISSLFWTRVAADSVKQGSKPQRCFRAFESPTTILSPHAYPVVTVAAAYLARLRVYRDELDEVNSDKTNGDTCVGYVYREILRHPQYGPGSSQPICTCQQAGCCRLGLCLGRGDAEDIWEPVSWSRIDLMEVVPYYATRDQVEKLIVVLEASSQWTDGQIRLLKSILAHRSLEIQTPKKDCSEWYWQLLSKHCKRCSVCGKTDTEISDSSSRLSCSNYKGTEKCWGCDAFFCSVGPGIGLTSLLLGS